MRHRPATASARAALGLLLAALACGAPPASGADAPPTASIPLDSRGLPQWQVRQWDDFPVGLELAGPAQLRRLLERVPLAAFDREQVHPLPGGRLRLRTRVTEAEARALREAGYAYEVLPDRERAGREAIERAWAEQAAGAGLQSAAALGVYHTHAQVGAFLQQAAAEHPDIAVAGSLGLSVQGRDIWSIRITDRPQLEEAEPEVRLAAAIHGDEAASLELLLYLVDHLTGLYGDPAHPEVTELVDGYDLTIVPCLNPDGLVAGTRQNANGVDLNRNFPVPDGTVGYDGTWTEETETILVRQHGEAGHFVLSCNGHGGALVVNYPWDYQYAPTPDEPAIVELSLEYSSRNLPMYYGDWPQGIVAGADWYLVKGSLQDWSYDATGCIDLTIEQGDLKLPPASQLDDLWLDNRDSFLALIRAARYGINGTVTAAGSGLPLAATVNVAGNDRPVATDPDHGDWYKLLPTGSYDLTFTAVGYQPLTVAGVATTWGTPTVLDVQLDPLPVGTVAGTVRDGRGARLEAVVTAWLLPDTAFAAADTSGAADGAYALGLGYGDYLLTVASDGHLPAARAVTVAAAARTEDFLLDVAEEVVLARADFEDGPDGWLGWEREGPARGHDSDWALTDSPGDGATYPPDADLATVLDLALDLGGLAAAELTYWARWDLETDWDCCRVEISGDGGGGWQPVATARTVPASGQGAQTPTGAPVYEGLQADWVLETVDLAPWLGRPDVRVRLRLGSDGSVEHDGFHLDDVLVRGVRPTVTAAGPPPAAAALRAWPNPFNPRTTVAFALARPGPARLAVYDVRGRLVRTLLAAGELPAGPHAVVWDGRNAAGAAVASGTYLARLEAGGATRSLGLVLLK